MGKKYILTFQQNDLNNLFQYIRTYNHLRLDELKDGDELEIDFSNVRFVRAHGLLFLVMLIKKVFAKTRKRVLLSNISTFDYPRVYGYLERTDFFILTMDWIKLDPSQDYSEACLYDRSRFSPTLLQITHLSKDDYDIGFTYVKKMISHHAIQILGDIIPVYQFYQILGELVCNIQEWSEGDGYIVVQRYRNVYDEGTYLSISDDGIGIWESLKRQKNDPNNNKPLEKLKMERDFFEFAFTEKAARSSSGGLYGILQILRKLYNRSYLIGISGNYLYYFETHSDGPEIISMPYSFLGTMVNIFIKEKA